MKARWRLGERDVGQAVEGGCQTLSDCRGVPLSTSRKWNEGALMVTDAH